jgi:hypothetical protein
MEKSESGVEYSGFVNYLWQPSKPTANEYTKIAHLLDKREKLIVVIVMNYKGHSIQTEKLKWIDLNSFIFTPHMSYVTFSSDRDSLVDEIDVHY